MRLPFITGLAMLALCLAGCDGRAGTAQASPVKQSVALDGDTFEAGWPGARERYRLARIDAPEMPGHCRPGRRCVEGDPERSKVALQWFLNQIPVCKVKGVDVYGRKLVECWINGSNVNDDLMTLGFAEEYRR